jgi:hypothetical protein
MHPQAGVIKVDPRPTDILCIMMYTGQLLT